MPDQIAEATTDLLALRLDLFLERTIAIGLESEHLLNAYAFIEKAHLGHVTITGHPYSGKRVDTALAVKANGGDIEATIASLVLDVLEDTSVTKEELVTIVGEDTVSLTSIVNRLQIQTYFGATSSNNSRSLLSQAFQDSRVALVYLCDALSNARILPVLPDQKRIEYSKHLLKVVAASGRDAGYVNIASNLELLATMNVDDRFSAQRNRYMRVSGILASPSLPSTTSFRELVARLPRLAKDIPAVGQVGSVPDTDEILSRVRRIDAALCDYKAPKIEDLFAGVMGLNLKGVWLWAVHLIRLSKRARTAGATTEEASVSRQESLERKQHTHPVAVDGIVANALLDGTDQAAERAAQQIKEVQNDKKENR